MKLLRGAATHLGMILPLMALVFLILDQFNPAMAFWGGTLPQIIIATGLVLGVINAIRLIVEERTR